jgi:hypothetical protein
MRGHEINRRFVERARRPSIAVILNFGRNLSRELRGIQTDAPVLFSFLSSRLLL